MNETTWTQSQAIALCVIIESICPQYGAHIALSGGCLYKTGNRKDCDVILYRIRQAPKIDFEGLFASLAKVGINKVSGFGFCHKLEWTGKRIDMLSPEEEGDEYPEDEISEPLSAESLDPFFPNSI